MKRLLCLLTVIFLFAYITTTLKWKCVDCGKELGRRYTLSEFRSHCDKSSDGKHHFQSVGRW